MCCVDRICHIWYKQKWILQSFNGIVSQHQGNAETTWLSIALKDGWLKWLKYLFIQAKYTNRHYNHSTFVAGCFHGKKKYFFPNVMKNVKKKVWVCHFQSVSFYISENLIAISLNILYFHNIPPHCIGQEKWFVKRIWLFACWSVTVQWGAMYSNA